jgi:glycosyltransferase involved in cell wall biosynthesis
MKVALTAEGTYPHQFGGVSVWCDQLVRGMPEHKFQLVALVASGMEPVRWSLPSNVASLTTIPLWGPPPPVPWRARRQRGRARPPVRKLINVLYAPPTQARARFADVMREMFSYAQSGNLSAALTSDDAVRVLSEAWQKRWPPDRQAGLNGHARHAIDAVSMPDGQAILNEGVPAGHPAAEPVGAAPTLHDAVTAMQLIEHVLRPLSYAPVEADLVHAVTNGVGVLPALAAKWQHGMPMIVSEHGVYIREQYMHLRRPPFAWPVKELYLRLLRRICMLGYQEADLITPGNVYNRRWEDQLGADPARVRTVYNGVNPADFPMLDGEPEVPTISWVGRVDPVKDLETLLAAFSLVLKKMPAARLRMFGSPPRGRESYLERCRALAADLGISEQATFEGRVARIRDAYQAGHVVVLCSISEGFPYSLVEAMACGRPCVGTDVGGVSEALAGTGIVVPPRSPAVLAQACVRLLRDAGLRQELGAAARLRALEFFTVDRTISTFDEMYKFLGSGQGIPAANSYETPGGSAGAARPGNEASIWPPSYGSKLVAWQADTDIMAQAGKRSPAASGQDETDILPRTNNGSPAAPGHDESEAAPDHAALAPDHAEAAHDHAEAAPDHAEPAHDHAEPAPDDTKVVAMQPVESAG